MLPPSAPCAPEYLLAPESSLAEVIEVDAIDESRWALYPGKRGDPADDVNRVGWSEVKDATHWPSRLTWTSPSNP